MRLLLPALFSLLSLLASPAHAELAGKVIAVLDGDTVDVLPETKTPFRVRLAEIDAPEKRQPYGNRARQHLAALVHGQHVQILPTGQDRYGRTLGHLRRLDGLDVNREMVAAGMAWAYRAYLRDPQLLSIENTARAAQLGLWRDPAPIPPWEFRKNAK